MLATPELTTPESDGLDPVTKVEILRSLEEPAAESARRFGKVQVLPLFAAVQASFSEPHFLTYREVRDSTGHDAERTADIRDQHDLSERASSRARQFQYHGRLLKESLECQSAGQTGGGYTRSPNFWLRRLLPFPPYLLGRNHHDLGTCKSGERDSGFRRIGLCAWVRFGSSMTHGSDRSIWRFRRKPFYNDTLRYGAFRRSDRRLLQI
jgi:hypothetical protein